MTDSRRRLRQRSTTVSFETRAIICLIGILWGWMFLFFVAYFGYFRSSGIQVQKTVQVVSGGSSPLVIITYKRANYLNETLHNVYENISPGCTFACPIIISEDGRHGGINDIVHSYKGKFETKGIPLIHIHHRQQVRTNPYVALARHYGWALSMVFKGKIDEETISFNFDPSRAIILEEDIKVAPDFFTYMESTSAQLDKDPTLYAVSAFNDNGHVDNCDPKRLLRSDFFPGLGWMMTKYLWDNELKSNWAPNGYWDDWFRDPEQRKNRQIIRPELSRSYHFGTTGGTSHNQFGTILKRIQLNQRPIRWELEDLTYLNDVSYSKDYTKLVMSSALVNTLDEAKVLAETDNVRIEYDGYPQFRSLAKKIGIMDDEKSMVPRTAYKGIVETRQGKNLLFLSPKGVFVGY